MKSTAIMGALEIIGEISDIRVKGEFLVLNIRTTVPVGWNLKAALSHHDLLAFVKFLLRPSNLLYVLFGFGKPRDKQSVPEY